jgi:hypothetical protein
VIRKAQRLRKAGFSRAAAEWQDGISVNCITIRASIDANEDYPLPPFDDG